MDSDIRMDAQSSQSSVFKEFCQDRESIRSLGVTPRELEALSRASLLGSLSCKDDVLFMLQQLRENEKPTGADASTADAVHGMTEKLRKAALSNMRKQDTRDAIRNSALLRRVRKMLGQQDPLPVDDSTSY